MTAVQEDSIRQGVNQNHTEHISIGKMLGILDSPNQLEMCRDPQRKVVCKAQPDTQKQPQETK